MITRGVSIARTFADIRRIDTGAGKCAYALGRRDGHFTHSKASGVLGTRDAGWLKKRYERQAKCCDEKREANAEGLAKTYGQANRRCGEGARAQRYRGGIDHRDALG